MKKRDFNESQTVEIPWPDMIKFLDACGSAPPADPVVAVRLARDSRLRVQRIAIRFLP